MIDGVEGKEYDYKQDDRNWLAFHTPVFSADSKRIAYRTGRNGKEFIVVDGVEGKEYEKIQWMPAFSPDSKRIEYCAVRDGKEFTVVDGVEGKEYENIVANTFVFSPDSKRTAYVAASGRKRFIVVDNVEGKRFVGVWNPVFSPDSKSITYYVERSGRYVEGGGKYVFVIDGVEGNEYNLEFPFPRAVFSPDGKHIAHAARLGPKGFVIVDGVEGKAYDDAGELCVFSPDSKHLAYNASRNRKQIIVVDDATSMEEYDEPISLFVFDSPTKFHTIMRRGNEFFSVDVEITGEALAPAPAKPVTPVTPVPTATEPAVTTPPSATDLPAP